MWCDVKKCGCDALYSVYDIKHVVVLYHTYKGGDIMERGGVRHRYSGCDVTNIVNMMLYTMDMMSSYIADEIS